MSVWTGLGHVRTLLVSCMVTLLTLVELAACVTLDICTMNGRCLLPGSSYKDGCNTFNITRRADGCHSELVEIGCEDPTTGFCVKEGSIVKGTCEAYTCMPNGRNNPYVLKSAACSFKNLCYNVGESLPFTGCGSVECVYKTPGATSGKVMIKIFKGCKHKGKCLLDGDQIMEHNSRYCVTRQCTQGKLRLVSQGCWSKYSECKFVTKNTIVLYTLFIYSRTCTAVCSIKGKRTHIENIQCHISW